jgi:hypothetical protein
MLDHLQPIADHLKDGALQGRSHVYEAPEIIGTCINGIAPGCWSAMLGLILIGALMVAYLERRKSVAVKTQAAPVQSNRSRRAIQPTC